MLDHLAWPWSLIFALLWVAAGAFFVVVDGRKRERERELRARIRGRYVEDPFVKKLNRK